MIDTKKIWSEYQKGIDYHSAIDLYENVEINQNFVNGDQWHGVNAPDIEKPVFNVLRPATDWFNSMLVSDDIAIQCDFDHAVTETPENPEQEQIKWTKQAIESIVTKSIYDVWERTRYKARLRDFVRNACVDGGSYKHWWYDTSKKINEEYDGCINMELIDNINVIFGDPSNIDEQKQPYIIIVSKLPTETVKQMVAKNLQDGILSNWDDMANLEEEARQVSNMTTVLTKLWKEKGTVHYCKTTENVIIKPDTDLGLKMYPISKMNWKTKKSAYQGISPLTEVIPNQIMINKAYMMINEYLKKTSFPKLVYNQDLITEWSNKVEALAVHGDPREAVASATPLIQMNPQLFQHANDLIDKTNKTLGIQDVSLGSVAPNNTSAIIALQKTAAQPLELQRLALYESVENDVRIIVDIMSVSYGVRSMPIETEVANSTMPFDFSDLSYEAFNMNVEVGQSYYWSNVMSIQTIDNLWAQKIIPDAITYLEQLPNGAVKDRQAIINAIRKIQTQQQTQAQPVPQIPIS